MSMLRCQQSYFENMQHKTSLVALFFLFFNVSSLMLLENLIPSGSHDFKHGCGESSENCWVYRG